LSAGQHNHVAMGRNGMLSNVQYEYGVQLGRHTGRFLFVVSHMRSFSTLLCHILGSHPEISGYGEAQLSYFSRLDLQRLARKVQQITGNPVLGRYVLDKILHNHREIAPAILDRPEIKVLFLLRNPEDTFRSILNMSHARGPKGKYSDPARVLDYYVTRLRQLEGYCTRLGGNARFVESEGLLCDTERVLVELSRWLELGEPLKADYRTFRLTGEAGYGDPSPTILAGTVVRNDEDRHRHYVPMPIPDALLQQGLAAHALCREGLAKRCVAC
jgi:hypothetical protein